MKFSIVTISFNQAEFLKRTIDSVLEQEAPNVDLDYIVVDPGSRDGSRDIIDSYGDRIAHRLYEKDEGPGDGLNKGFARASGEIYGYLNSDDVLLPGALRHVADYFAAHPDVDVVSGHSWIIDRDDNRLRLAWSDRFRRTFCAYGASIQLQPSTFIRREAFLKSGGFNIANRVGWDAELLIDLHLTGARFGLTDAFLSGYRLHGDSITNRGHSTAKLRSEWARGFQMLMGRPPNGLDWPLTKVFRVLKAVSNPRASLERIRRGRIYNRGVA